MSSCCRTCDHRNHAVNAHRSSSAPKPQLNVSLITLSFHNEISAPNSKQRIELKTVLNDIIDSVDSSPHPTTFTSWSPCLLDPRKAVIITTAKDTTTSPLFASLQDYLSEPPNVQQIYLDYSILSLAAFSPDERVACDIIQLQAPDPGVAAAIGKHFGWDPKRSSLSLQMSSCNPAAFSRPGDLVKDIWAWAELRHEDPVSPSTVGSSFASSYESLPKPTTLISWNSDEKNMSLPFPEDENEGGSGNDLDDETLVMLFQWSSHEAADRFKHPLQTSHGPNDDEVSKDLWDRQVAHPIRQLQAIGARVVMHKLELRGVESRHESSTGINPGAGRVRSGSKRLSVLASGLSDRVSGFWR